MSPATHRRTGPRWPLWFKLGATFGGLVIVLLSAAGLWGFQLQLDRESVSRDERLTTIATRLAAQLDGDNVANFRHASDMTKPTYVQMTRMLRWAQEANGLHWIGMFGLDGDRLYYLMDADDVNPVPLNYPFFDAWPPLLRAFEGGTHLGYDLEDDYGYWDAAFAPVRRANGEVVGVVTTLLSVTWRDMLVTRELRWLLLQIGLTALLVFLTAVGFARHLARDLGTLSEGARAVAAGDLDVEIPIKTHDEVGQLAEAFAEMVRGLRERDAIRDAFGRFVNPDVAERVLADPESLAPGGELREVTLLMSDLRGFTGLSERLSPAEVVTLLNAYLGRMAQLVNENGGFVVDFIGDAVMAVFEAGDVPGDDALRATTCAVEMQRVMETFNPDLSMGIGLNRGPVIVGTIGSQHRMKYGVVGDSVNVTSRVESFTVGGEILVADAMREILADKGTFRGPIRISAKGKRAPLVLHALVALGDLLVPLENQAPSEFAPVAIPVVWHAVVGSRVDDSGHEGTLIGLGLDEAELLTAAVIDVHDDVKVYLLKGGDEAALYAKVHTVRVDGDTKRVHLRFTSLDQGAKFLLADENTTQELPKLTRS